MLIDQNHSLSKIYNIFFDLFNLYAFYALQELKYQCTSFVTF